MKLKYDLLHEEKVELKVQLDILHKKLEQLQVENERPIEKYREMEDEKQHDNTIQKADSVCVAIYCNISM